jgi:hypothetical protein
MKKLFTTMLLALSFAIGIQAQQLPNPPMGSEIQQVATALTRNGAAIVITGTIKDLLQNKYITNAQISLSGFGKELIDANVDKFGHYAIALDKSQLKFPITLKIHIKGYKKFILRDLNPTADVVYADINLVPEEDMFYRDEPNKKVLITDEPFSSLIIQY